MTAKLESLFRVYASDLARFAPELTDRFGCPLCYRVIGQTTDLREVVAEEHIVPRKLGGRIVTLTCRKCNSGHGSALDAHLIQRVKVETRRLPLRARMRIGEGE